MTVRRTTSPATLGRALALLLCAVFALGLGVPAKADPRAQQAIGAAMQVKGGNFGSATVQTQGQYLGNYYMPTVLMAKAAAMAQGTVTQANVLMVGDSVAGNTSGIILPNLQRSLGAAGYGLDYAGTTFGPGLAEAVSGTAYLLDGTTHAYDYTRWISGTYTVLPANGDAATFSVGGGNYTFNKLQVFYEAESGAGSFQVQTNNNGAGWVTQATINSTNATPIGGVYSVTLTRAPYQVRLVSTGGGTVRIIGVQMVDTTVSGVVLNAIQRGGLQLPDANVAPSAIITPILAAIAPDHITWEAKENQFECPISTGAYTPTPYSATGTCPDSSAPTNFATQFAIFMGKLRAANTYMDVVLWGSEPTGADTYSDQLNDNIATSAYAKANGLIYVDLYYATQGAYSTLNGVGLINNGENTHINNNGKNYMASLGWGLVYQPYLTLLGYSPQSAFSPASYSKAFHVTINRDPNGSNAETGTLTTDAFGLDVMLKGQRSIQFMDESGNLKGYLGTTSSIPGLQVPVLGLTTTPNVTSGPALRPIGTANNSGIYSSDVAGDASPEPFGASTFLAYGSGGNATQFKGIGEGVAELCNSACTDLVNIDFGGTNSTFPAIFRSGTLLKFRLADNSADAPISASYVKSGTYTVSGLPSASTAGAGARAAVTDATACTFNSTPTGGGSTFCPVVSTGSAWVEG